MPDTRTSEAAAGPGGAGTGQGTSRGSEPGALRTLLVALAVCGACSLLLSMSVVVLRPYQLEHQRLERQRGLHALVAGLPGVAGLLTEAGGARIEVRVVDLATGAEAPEIDPERLLRGDEPVPRVPLPPGRDPAGIDSIPRYAPVYLLIHEDDLHSIVLPVFGRGYLSMMRGYLALAGDANTVRGIAFTEHAETPGLGAEIESPAWQARWAGKQLRDEQGRVRIAVVPAAPDPADPAAAYAVQGISGATRTGDGVTALVRFWIGPDGFGPYLDSLRQEEFS